MVLKRGDNNDIVKKIQVVLGVDPVGNFGPKTEEAVKAWQTKNGLTPDGVVGPATLAKMGITVDSKPVTTKPTVAPKYTAEQIKTAVVAKGYKWFEGGDYMLNIIGARNSSTGQKVTNLFDDHITLSYTVDGEEKFHCWPATTDPGTKGVMKFGNKAGVARLVEGQYIDSHIMRLHAGKYEALGQNKPVKVYRDLMLKHSHENTRIVVDLRSKGAIGHFVGVDGFEVVNNIIPHGKKRSTVEIKLK